MLLWRGLYQKGDSCSNLLEINLFLKISKEIQNSAFVAFGNMTYSSRVLISFL
jgi:hypothetical protein